MILPQELVDEILVHLQHDIQALENCSLVAKSWTYPSQKLLYTYVFICPFKYETWQEIASPATAKLLQHVHSLHCFRFNSLYDFHEDYLKSFHRLQKLDLDEVDHFELDAVKLFPAFENSLSSLFIYHLSFNLDAFIKLLCYFPNLRYLQLFDLTFDTEHLTTPPPSSTPLRGTLSLHAFSLENTDILLRVLCQLELEYDKLEIDGVLVDHSPSHVRSIISTCGKTLTHLKLGPHDARSLHTLENLSELRELDWSLPRSEEVFLISTITSTKIRKIVFARDLGDLMEQSWSPLDAELSSLADRLRTSGYQHVLDLEFRWGPGFAKEVLDMDPDGFLPEFMEKGRITISQSSSGRILYCSDGSVRGGLDSEGFKGSETAQAAPTQ